MNDFLSPDQLQALPEDVRKYFEVDDAGNVRPNGFIPRKAHDDMVGRYQNQAAKAKEELARFEGVDPEAARKAAEDLQALQDKLEAGDNEEQITEILAKRTERMRADHANEISARDKKLEKAIAERDAIQSRLDEAVLGGQADKARAELEIMDDFSEDFRMHVLREFKTEEGRPIRRDSDGNIITGKDGVSPETVAEFGQSLLEKRPAWRRVIVNGGGATQSRSTGSPTGRYTPEQVGAMSMADYIKAREEGRI